jgi:hypothetical protein
LLETDWTKIDELILAAEFEIGKRQHLLVEGQSETPKHYRLCICHSDALAWGEPQNWFVPIWETEKIVVPGGHYGSVFSGSNGDTGLGEPYDDTNKLTNRTAENLPH